MLGIPGNPSDAGPESRRYCPACGSDKWGILRDCMDCYSGQFCDRCPGVEIVGTTELCCADCYADAAKRARQDAGEPEPECDCRLTMGTWALEYLASGGLFPTEVAAVMTACKKSEANAALESRWSDDVSGYPPQLMAVLIVELNSQAVRWIDANKPGHWARGVFAREAL
jgi:hypothetical protein